MDVEFSTKDFVFTVDKNKTQIGGYNINNKLLNSNNPLFKTYSDGKKTLTIPTGLLMNNTDNIQKGGSNLNDNENDLYFKKNDDVLVEESLFSKLEQLAGFTKKTKKRQTQKRRKNIKNKTKRKT